MYVNETMAIVSALIAAAAGIGLFIRRNRTGTGTSK